MDASDDRRKLLLEMYNRLLDNSSTHVLVVWQSVGVLVGAFAILALTEKQVISMDVAGSLIVLIAGWLIAHVYDASYWYNRNIAIAANIEKEFLCDSDLRNIHYYFGKHRPGNKMIVHLRIQMALGIGIGLIVLVFHFLTRVAPCLQSQAGDLERLLPYLVSVPVAIGLFALRAHRDRCYTEFLQNSPGRPVDTTGITYGEGHGFPRIGSPKP